MKNIPLIIIILFVISTIAISQVTYQTNKEQKQTTNKIKSQEKKVAKQIDTKKIKEYTKEIEKIAKEIETYSSKCVGGNDEACKKMASLKIQNLELACKYNISQTSCDEFKRSKKNELD